MFQFILYQTALGTILEGNAKIYFEKITSA